MKKIATFVLLAAVAVWATGCGKTDAPKDDAPKDDAGVGAPATTSSGELPAFSVASSEYPSWSTLMVAAKAGLVNGKEGGAHGPLETKWGVDLVLEVKDYDPCLTLFANGAVDAVCMTNMDSLNPALGRPCTAICPTSTSVGADKVIAVGFTKPEDLKGQTTYGLAKSVSQFVFVRCLEKRGLNPADYPFENLDPGAAATALQSGAGEVKSICVWNPFALQTLRTNQESTTVFDSAEIPEEVIDMIVIGNDSLKKEGGEAFANLLCDTFYEVCDRLADPDKTKADATLTALGEDFSKLPLEDMRIVVQETRFYDSPEKGQKLFSSPAYQKTMEIVVETCQKIGVLDKGKQPTLGYNDDSAQLNFSTKYMEAAANK